MKSFFDSLSFFDLPVVSIFLPLSGHPRGSREADDRHHQRDHPALSFPGRDQIFLHAALHRGQTPHRVGTNLTDPAAVWLKPG